METFDIHNWHVVRTSSNVLPKTTRTKVSHAHEDRLVREKQLLATMKDLNEERESEKV